MEILQQGSPSLLCYVHLVLQVLYKESKVGGYMDQYRSRQKARTMPGAARNPKHCPSYLYQQQLPKYMPMPCHLLPSQSSLTCQRRASTYPSIIAVRTLHFPGEVFDLSLQLSLLVLKLYGGNRGSKGEWL